MATVGRGHDAQALVQKLRDRATESDPQVPEIPPKDAPEIHAVARTAPAPAPTANPAARSPRSAASVRIVSVAAPIWTRGLDEPNWLLPEPVVDQPRLVFSVFDAQDSGNAPLTLPLYLADACRFVSRLPTLMLIPWASGQGPIVTEARSPRESMLSAMPRPTEHDISVSGSVRSDGHHHHLELDIFQSASAKLICSEHFDAKSPGELALRAEERMIAVLEGVGGATQTSGTLYSRPPPGSRNQLASAFAIPRMTASATGGGTALPTIVHRLFMVRAADRS